MATYEVNYWNYVSYHEETKTFTVTSEPIPWPAIYNDEQPDSSFYPGENILVDGYYETYIGYTNLGILTFYQGVYGISTPTAAYHTGDVVSVNVTDPFIVCFLAGTMISTPTGDVAVEALTAGDLVLTTEGAAKPVRWLARQTVSTVFADPLRILPIRIAAGALGDGLPSRDLFVSTDHALLLDGLLIQAGALVNGTTIVRHADMPQTFTYYHVELDDHSLLLAEGVPAETFVDNVTRRSFDNWQEAPETPIAELDLPRVKSARQLPARIRGRLAEPTAA
ncbi:Hint domain-containing protein [Ancylobacter sonchi]|uniref:Hint domain-containing protein n=1 Tax=Ancylobacter sonchi TaxID=1937790 RepID=UPI001BD32975|nr:Hint domain-containing protein [Ancylobacter sonchi]MBS7533241.1 Hint domain-containing protein [Ancylobacter sonchi]